MVAQLGMCDPQVELSDVRVLCSSPLRALDQVPPRTLVPLGCLFASSMISFRFSYLKRWVQSKLFVSYHDARAFSIFSFNLLALFIPSSVKITDLARCEPEM